ncbi:MAG: hypothetical protein HY811_00510 [Planctomycetes bacterium]|nr:hypothetical protein [Planctomycetota bacterium]
MKFKALRKSAKIILLISFFLAVFPAFIHAQEAIQLSPSEWNAGEVELDKEYRQKVIITLPANASGEITQIRPSCECLSAKIIRGETKEERRETKNEIGEIEVILHANHTLNTRFRIYLYIHINNDSKPIAKFNVTGRIKGKGFGLGVSEAVIFRTRVAKDYETITKRLDELKKIRPEITFTEHLAKDLESFRLFARFEKEYMVPGHADIEMFMGDYFYIGQGEVMKKLDGLLVEKAMCRDKGGVAINYFYSVGCGGCFELEGSLFPKLYAKYGDKIVLKKYDIGDEANYELLVNMEKKCAITANEPVSVFVGGHYLGGTKNIVSGLDGLIEQALKAPDTFRDISPEAIPGAQAGKVPEAIKERFNSFNIMALIGAGLLDGFNPCAFATVVFFVSFLAFAGMRRREILLAGIVYTMSVFATYLLLGVGLFNAVRSLSAYAVMAHIVLYGMAAMVFSFAALSLYDMAVYLRTKKTGGMVLQLPLSLKQKIHAAIRNNMGRERLILGMVVTGFLVTLFEAVCTGQVYLPTIIFVMKDPELKTHAMGYLVLYNLMFILPLVVVFMLSYFGVSSKAMEVFAQKNVVLSKLLLALLFIALGMMLLVV